MRNPQSNERTEHVDRQEMTAAVLPMPQSPSRMLLFVVAACAVAQLAEAGEQRAPHRS